MSKSQSVLAKDEIALLGYISVFYLEGYPSNGSPDYRVELMESIWGFSNQRHADIFLESPHTFIPQYRGYCALAMSLGELAPESPESKSITNGKLYFHNSGATSFEVSNNAQNQHPLDDLFLQPNTHAFSTAYLMILISPTSIT